MSDNDDVREWLGRLTPERRERAAWLAERVHAASGGIAEAIRWKRLTFTVYDNWHHWLCAVADTKRDVVLVFHKGSLLDDPDGLLAGESQYTRQAPYAIAVAHPRAIEALVRDAIAHQTDKLNG